MVDQNQLARAAFERGIFGTFGAAVTYVSANQAVTLARNIAEGLAYIREQLRFEREQVQAQIRAGEARTMIGEDKAAKRPRTTDLTKPVTNRLSGNVVQVGDVKASTRSSHRCRTSHGSKGSLSSIMKRLISRNVCRFQSISEDTRGSLVLNTVSDANTDPDRLYLPMYAFDISTLAYNVASQVTTKTFNAYESCPFYRMYKSYPDGVLNPSTRNYHWAVQNGLNNGPSAGFKGTADPLWHPEFGNNSGFRTSDYKINWTAFDVVLRCRQTTPCRVHFSVVRFKDGTGPARRYANGQEWKGTTNYSLSTEDSENAASISSHDVFWETFWDSKVGHPLSKYNNASKHKFIEFLKDDVINVDPESNPGSVLYEHLYSNIISDGTWQTVLNDSVADDTVARDAVTLQYGQQPNVYQDRGFCFGYNVVRRNNQITHPALYLPNDKARDMGTWVLIWMEDLQIHKNAVQSGQGIDVIRPDQYTANVFGSECCAFDIRVRQSFDVTNDRKYL